MMAEQRRHLLVELADLLLEELQLFQHHPEEPPVDGLEVRARAECVAQLFRGGAQTIVSQSGQDRRLGCLSFADRKRTRLNSSHRQMSYADFCLQKNSEPAVNFASSAPHATWSL